MHSVVYFTTKEAIECSRSVVKQGKIVESDELDTDDAGDIVPSFIRIRYGNGIKANEKFHIYYIDIL